MSKITVVSLLASAFILTACQTTKQFDGHSGYSIESQSNGTATLSYTLASQQNMNMQQQKLQHACQKVLGQNKNYRIQILSENEVLASDSGANSTSGIALGNSHTSFGLSNTSTLNNSNDDYAVRQGLNARPNVLKTIRYTCS